MITKKNMFGDQLNNLADCSKALSHPARIQILNILADHGTCICGEIVSELPLAQSSVSQHLKELKSAGLIKGEVEPPKTCYCLNYKSIKNLQQEFNEMFNRIIESESVTECC